MSNRLPITRPSKHLKSGHHKALVRYRFVLLVFSVFFFSITWAVASAAEVTDLIINNSQGHLLLSLKVRDALKKETEKLPADEISSTIVFSVELYQINSFWFDKEISRQTATNTLKYDPLKKEYRLMRSWHSGPPMVVTDLDQAEKLLTEVRDLKVVALARLEKNRNYQIRVQAICQDKNAFICGPPGCFKTDWYTVDFTF